MFCGEFVVGNNRTHVGLHGLHWNKTMLVCSWISSDVRCNQAEQIVMAYQLLQQFLAFVLRVAAKHFTRSDGINGLCKVNVEYSECVSVALVIWQAICMRRIILSSMACPSQSQFFPHYFINGAILEGKYWPQNVYFDILYTVCLKHFSSYGDLIFV